MTITNKLLSIDYWYDMIIANQKVHPEEINVMIKALASESPTMTSITFERTCNLQCSHCIYQAEKSSRKMSREHNLVGAVLNIAEQLPHATTSIAPILLHEGRILNPWHLEVLSQVRAHRPDIKIGLIDNGTYLQVLNSLGKFRLDWLDISIDGLEDAHNRQRNNKTAWRVAIEGLRGARTIVKPHEEGGRVNSLFTLTAWNYDQILQVSNLLLDTPLVDGLDITTMSPARPELMPLEISLAQFQVFWKLIKEASGKHNAGTTKLYFRIYHLEDIRKLCLVFGPKKFSAVVKGTYQDDQNKLIGVDAGRLTFMLDGVTVTYYPLSISIQETFLIDADATYRVPYSISRTLDELRAQRGKDGQALDHHTITQLTPKSDFKELYRKGVRQWWTRFGSQALQKELCTFSDIFRLAESG